jgi:ABC-type bacteriocin/lantibiotic exporter with double-glycine peptidase domain
LHGLSLRIRRGQRIALIGGSGSGKSTLLALLRGMYFPREGVALTVDGHAIPDWGRLAATVTLIPQEPELFENTILYNITLGLPYTRQEVNRVCQLVCFDEVLAQLPSGLDSNIQEKGTNLSGGQKQRLALARGLLAARNSSIVLLDEPTSSLDHRTEEQTYENLLEALSGKTVIAALHNLQLLRHFDYVYVLQGGYITEQGTPADLQRHGLNFSKLAQVQVRVDQQV